MLKCQQGPFPQQKRGSHYQGGKQQAETQEWMTGKKKKENINKNTIKILQKNSPRLAHKPHIVCFKDLTTIDKTSTVHITVV